MGVAHIQHGLADKDGRFGRIQSIHAMLRAIELAEDNLLAIGMPFTPDYQFHGRNKANKKRRNDKLRRLYNLEEKERKDNE